MWIEISDDIQEGLDSVSSSLEKKSIAINSILRSMLEGKHIIYISRNLLNKFLSMNYIDQTNKKYLHWVREKYVDLYSLKDRIISKIIISNDAKKIEVSFIKESEGKVIYKVPLEWFFCVNTTKFLTENETDYQLFLSISNYINRLNNFNNVIGINLDNDASHGANVVTKIGMSAEKHIVLCMLDSDRDMKDSGTGDTYKGANKQYKKLKKNNIVHLCSLISREKENLFPPDFYMLVCSNNEELKILSVLNNFRKEGDIIRFFDIKDGIKYKKYKDKRWSSYYAEVLKSLQEANIVAFPDSDDEDFICVQGIGSNMCDSLCTILFDNCDKARKELNKLNISADNINRIIEIRRELNKKLPEYIYNEWERIYSYLFSWGCCISEKYQPYYMIGDNH